MFRILLSFFLLFSIGIFPQEKGLKALVGGTLADGYGSDPIKNSVVVVEEERIKAIGTQDNMPISANVEMIFYGRNDGVAR